MNILEYAKRLGVEPAVDQSKPVDIEAGKAGYEKYLADEKKRKKSQEKSRNEEKWWEKIGRWMGNSPDTTLPLNQGFNQTVTAYANDASNSAHSRPSDDWTDYERWAFGEIYAQNTQDAYSFAKNLNAQYAFKRRNEEAEELKTWTERNAVNKVLGSIASLGINAYAGGAGYADAVAQIAGRGYTAEHDYLYPHEISNVMQSTVAEGLNEKSKVLGYGYNVGMSIAQSWLAAYTGGSAGALVQFFGMAASNGYTDAKNRGATDDEALQFGVLSGVAEAVPEMVSAKKFIGLTSSAQVETFFRSVVKMAGTEALEEGTTSALTELADRWVMQGKSHYALNVQQLMASGMSQAEAEQKALRDTLLMIAQDTATGALSGSISGAGRIGVSRLNQRYFQHNANTQAKETLTPEASNLIEEGKKYESSAKQAERLEKKLTEGKELSGYELRMLASSVSQATQDANVDAVRQAIVEKMKSEGVDEKQAKRLGEIALNKALGNEVSKIQDVMLKRNETASKVYNQIDENNMESELTDSKWIESTPLKQLRYEAKAEKEGAVANTQSTATTGVERLKQDLMAKKIAKDYKINDASLEGKFTVSEDDKIKFKKSGENSKIHTEEITTSLTKEDIAELTAIEKIANELGVEIYVYESKRNKDGSRTFTKADGEVTSDSGWYDPNDRSIHIDLRAGNNGEGTMLYTAAHELVHFMKDVSPEHFDALEKLVTAELIKGGKSIEALLQIQRDSLIENGKKQTDADFEEVAREEMVADACMKFLASKSAIAEIKALKTKNKGLWNALKKFFTSFFNKINKIYKNVDPDSSVGKYIGDMHSKAKAIRDAFMEGVTAAGEKYTAERKALGEGANVKVNSNGEFVQGASKDGKKILSNARTWKNGGRTTLKTTLESEGFSKEDVDAALTIMDEHMRLVEQFGSTYTAQDIANNAILTTDVKTGESVLSAIISNGDYPVNIDLLTICKKREAYQQVINRLCESGMINQATLDSLAIAEINKILGKYGFETACLGCYVESRRIRIQEWADTIVKEWNGIVDKLEGKGKGKYLNAASDAFVSDLSNEEISKLSSELDEAYERDGLKYGRQTVVKKMEQLQREVPALRKYLSVSDLITPTGRANLKSWSQEVNSLINCRYGTNTPKIIQKFNPYNSELAQYGIVPKAYKSLRDYLYAIGGARMQSFSDFIVENWFDYAQIVSDLSARKLPMHTYTKELSLVKLFGMTGIKINMSLIPDVDSSLGKEYAGLTKNSKGEYELIFADKDRYKATGGKSYMQSINFADAIALQNDPNYSANIGTIAIGISDKQIEMMLDDSRIRMVIPYHSSGMNPIFAHLVGIKNYNDYTNDQNTTVKRLVDANGKEKSVNLKKEQIASLTKGFQYNEALQRLGDARAAANEYKEWCRDTSKHTIEIDGKTYYAELTPKFEKFSAHENYYKLLTDYNAYDCITEESKPQQDVTQTYPENFATMLEDELKARDIYAKKQDAKWDDAMAEINAYLETHTRADTVKYADEHGIKISAKDRKLAKQESAKKEIRHSFRGKKSQGDNSLLDVAVQMEKSGSTSEEIRKATGWFKGYDGMWRIEIDDSPMKIKPLNYAKNGYLKLSDVIEHDELFNAYPELKDVWFAIDPSIDEGGRTTGSGIILQKYPSNTSRFDRGILLHEIQHVIQYIEGFAKGSTPQMFEEDIWNDKLDDAFNRRNAAANKLYAILRRRGNSIPKAEIENEQYYNLRDRDKIIDKYYFELSTLAESNKRTKEIWDEYWDATQELVRSTPYGKYRATAGEIEAYDVMARADYSAEQRKNTRPNIDRTDAIVLNDSNESYNLDENLGEQLNEWLTNKGKKGKKYNGDYFRLGTTPDVFVKHGAQRVEMIMYSDIVAKVTGMKGDDAHVIALDEIAKLPSQLNDPILLFKGSIAGSFIALTELVDKHGNDVVVAVHINRYYGRSKITKIASLYSKTNDYGENRIVNYVNNQIKNGNLLDASVKKAPIWFTTKGLQLPKVVQTIIDAKTIVAQKNGKINPSDEKSPKEIRSKARSTPSASIPYTSPTAKSIVTNIDSGYEYTKVDKIKTSYISAQIAMTNAQAGIETRAKQYNVKDIESLVQSARVATNQAQEMIGGNQYRIGSDTKDYLGEGLQKIIAPVQKKGKEYERTFYDYLFHYHNADRMSLERRSIEWNEQKKKEMKDLLERSKAIRKEQIELAGERNKWAYKTNDEAKTQRERIDRKVEELKRELVSIGKMQRKLQSEIDSFTVLKNKPVIGLNHDEIKAKKAEISARIIKLVEEKRKLVTKGSNEQKVKEITAEIESLKKERSALTAEVTEKESREIIAQYEKNYPQFIKTAKKIWNYSKNLNQFRVDAGLINQEQFDYLEKLYPHYIPTYRADTKTGIAAVKGKNDLSVSQSIRKASGSTKDLLNPIVIMARQTMETIRAGRINMIAKALYDGAASHKDTTYIKELSKEAVDKSTLDELDPTELRPKSNQITFFKNGERITLQVSSDIFAGFDAFTPQVSASNPLIQITYWVNDTFKKLVTAWNPFFIVRNSIRDIQDAGINTKYIKTFAKNYVRAGAEIRRNSALWQLYKAMGGTNVNLFDFDKGFKGSQTNMGFEAGLKNKIANANAFVECLPRFAEFISSIEDGNTAEQAILDAADVTTNFARTGTITKKLNSTVIPFLNPAIQGASKAIRNITSIRSVKDGVTLAAKAAMVGVIPFILNNLLYQGDDEYEDLKETDKENNYLIKVGDVFFKLPRGRMASVLAGATNRTSKTIKGEDADWSGYLKNASTQMNPMENMARTIFSPFLDVKNNVTWYGSAIEGREFENRSPSERYDENTSSIAISLGEFLNYSPKKIHYILDQYSGVIGDFVLPMTTKKAEKGFVSGNFTIDPVTSNKLSDQFYDLYYDAQYAKNSNPNDKTAEYQVKHLSRVKSAISDLYDKKSQIQNSSLSNSEKLAETRAIQVLINEMYKTAINDYSLITNAIEATTSVDDKYRYAEIQRLMYGAETALETYDAKVYEKSTLLEKTGISYDNFYEYYFGIKDIESDKDKNGKTISGSKKKKVIEKIKQLSVSEEKKLLLIAYSGYTIDSEKERQKLLKYINKLKLSTSDKKNLAEMCGFKYKNGKIVLK